MMNFHLYLRGAIPLLINELHELSYRSPWTALGWSAMIPGLGQLYNQEYILGILMIAMEFVINNNAQLNLAIHYSFNFDFDECRKVIDYHWLQFYPGLWTFSMWQAYNRAIHINENLQTQGVTPKKITVRYSGFFIGLTIGMHLGSIWAIGGSPIWSGLSIGFMVAAIGYALEKRACKARINN